MTVEKPEAIARGTGFAKAYDHGIVNHKPRNRAIIRQVMEAREYGLNAMILVSRTAHGALLEKAFKGLGLKASFIKGEDKQDARKRWLTALGDKSIDVLIGTTILDVGVDVPAVGLVVLAGGGKAEVSHRQRIGRGLRKKKSGPNVCLVVDFTDFYNKHLASHANQRMQIVKDTPGFAEGIIKGERFPFEKLGFEKIDRRETA
jgi:superfamily II DNA or RNA helicase